MNKMIINGHEFKVWIVDSVQTIKERISVELFNAVPIKFLQFDPVLSYSSMHSTQSFKAISLLDSVINQEKIQILNIKHQIPCRIDISEIERLFVSFNKELERFDKVGKLDLLIRISPELYDVWVQKYEFMWNDRKNTIETFNKSTKLLKEKVHRFTSFASQFEQIPMVKSVDLELQQVQITIQFKKGTPTLPDIFNQMQTTQYVPYINMWHDDLRVYKVRHGFKPEITWTELDTPNVIIIKANGEINLTHNPKFTTTAFTYAPSPNEREPMCVLRPANSNRISNCAVCKQREALSNKAQEQVDSVLFATLNINISKRNVNTDEFIDRVLVATSLSKDSIYKISHSSVEGTWIYPYQSLAIPVFTELAMNNRYFYESVVIDESIRASKKRENAFMYMIMSERPSSDMKRSILDSVSLKMKIVDKIMHGMGEGQQYAKARVKTPSVRCAKVYMELISRLLYVYNEQKANVISQYRRYIPAFMGEEEVVIDDDKTLPLRAIAPDLFLPKYSRKCLYKPTIISDELASVYREDKSHQVMTFPNYGEGSKYNYICEHQTHPYIGLRDNQMENMHVYPYLPCCYMKDQTSKKDSKYLHYFDPNYKPLTEHANRLRQDVFVTNKPVSLGMTGMIPRKLKKLFSLLQHDPEHCFVRYGNSFSSFSILESVLRAKGYFRKDNAQPMYSQSARPSFAAYEEVSEDERNFIIIQEKQKIATHKYAMAAKQELYDDSVDDIIHKIQTYMNPVDFIHLMEEAYDCNIFIFSSNKYFPDGNILIPRHSQFHIKSCINKPYILLYQHKYIDFNFGTSEALKSFAQCELLIRVPNRDPVNPTQKQFMFDPTDHVIESLWDVFKQLNKSYTVATYKSVEQLASCKEPFMLNDPPNVRFNSVESQEVDVYGKCRALNIRFGKHLIPIRCDPTVPYAAPESKHSNWVNDRIQPVDSIDIILKFAEKYSIKLIDQYLDVVTQETRQINGFFGNLKVSILTKLKSIQNLPTHISDVPRTDLRVLDVFNSNRKIAFLIYQYLLYVMSLYMHAKGISQALDKNQLTEFINTNVLISSNWKHRIPKSADIAHGKDIFVQNGKVVILSKEMLKRLLFMIRVYQQNHLTELLNYRNEDNIRGFYTDTFDFQCVDSAVTKCRYGAYTILNSSESIANLIKTYEIDNSIVNFVKIMATTPYFFSNDLINRGLVYLAISQPSSPSGFQQAIYTIQIWNTQNRLPNKKDLDNLEAQDLEQSISMFSYVNEFQIKKISSHDTQTVQSGSAILGYRYSGETRFVALLTLEQILPTCSYPSVLT